jgi:hypothetical protein
MAHERIDTEAVAEKWLQQCGPCDIGMPSGCTHPDEDYRPVMAALVEELERTRRGAQTLGHIVEQQGRMVLDVTGRHDLIGEDGDGDWGAVWDHLYELPAKAWDEGSHATAYSGVTYTDNPYRASTASEVD